MRCKFLQLLGGFSEVPRGLDFPAVRPYASLMGFGVVFRGQVTLIVFYGGEGPTIFNHGLVEFLIAYPTDRIEPVGVEILAYDLTLEFAVLYDLVEPFDRGHPTFPDRAIIPGASLV